MDYRRALLKGTPRELGPEPEPYVPPMKIDYIPENPPTMEDIPPELICIVLSHLDGIDYMNAIQSCRQLRYADLIKTRIEKSIPEEVAHVLEKPEIGMIICNSIPFVSSALDHEHEHFTKLVVKLVTSISPDLIKYHHGSRLYLEIPFLDRDLWISVVKFMARRVGLVTDRESASYFWTTRKVFLNRNSTKRGETFQVVRGMFKLQMTGTPEFEKALEVFCYSRGYRAASSYERNYRDFMRDVPKDEVQLLLHKFGGSPPLWRAALKEKKVEITPDNIAQFFVGKAIQMNTAANEWLPLTHFDEKLNERIKTILSNWWLQVSKKRASHVFSRSRHLYLSGSTITRAFLHEKGVETDWHGTDFDIYHSSNYRPSLGIRPEMCSGFVLRNDMVCEYIPKACLGRTRPDVELSRKCRTTLCSQIHCEEVYDHKPHIQTIRKQNESMTTKLMKNCDTAFTQAYWDGETVYGTYLFWLWVFHDVACVSPSVHPLRFEKYLQRGFNMTETQDVEPRKERRRRCDRYVNLRWRFEQNGS